MRRNLGDTRLRRSRRCCDPMVAYDRLPSPLRQWLSEASLPWSPQSARKIWAKTLARGHSAEEALAALSRAEARMLARDRQVVQPMNMIPKT